MKGIIFQAVVGVFIGAGAGALLGFISCSLLGKLYPSGLIGFDLDPGIVGAFIVGLVGSVVGLITGAFSLGTFQVAALAVLIYALLKGRAIYSHVGSALRYFEGGDLNGRLIFRDILAHVTLLLDVVLIGMIVAMSMQHLFTGSESVP